MSLFNQVKYINFSDKNWALKAVEAMQPSVGLKKSKSFEKMF